NIARWLPKRGARVRLYAFGLRCILAPGKDHSLMPMVCTRQPICKMPMVYLTSASAKIAK
ncbi:hypothetical protein KXD93_30470, partial [Mucilaginibacter sp. BJC16-A38]|uniref:hypothetical protein n=1 Tax=Mucilaginibacter phenanthrenivorans TaxID=1234842 RepID=UPI002157D8D1